MYLPQASAAQIRDAVLANPPANGESTVVLIAEKDAPALSDVVAALAPTGHWFCGALFPGLIYGHQRKEEGAVLLNLPTVGPPVISRNLDRDSSNLGPVPDLEPEQSHTAIVMVDGLTSDIGGFLSALFHRYGHSVHCFGGGAGSLSLKQAPCVFANDGVAQDAAVTAFIPLRSQLGVRHGWQKIRGPIVATRTNRNVIAELNWRPAFEVYREVVEDDASIELTRDGFFTFSKEYPFGIYREGNEDVVRDPIAVNEAGELVCVGEVPENTVLNILKGERESLVQAAGQAAADCQPQAGSKPRQGLVADCITRSIYLDDDFTRELQAVVDCMEPAGLVPEGMLTLGEIASDGGGSIEFFNKTIVAGVLHG